MVGAMAVVGGTVVAGIETPGDMVTTSDVGDVTGPASQAQITRSMHAARVRIPTV